MVIVLEPGKHALFELVMRGELDTKLGDARKYRRGLDTARIERVRELLAVIDERTQLFVLHTQLS